jgi:rhamnosyltransferase
VIGLTQDLRESDLPRVCVLLAAFNGGEFLEKQLITILRQDQVSVTIYIRDDGSTDGTRAVVRRFAASYPNVYEANDAEVGATGSPTKSFFRLFTIVDFSNFDFVALADQDDIWLPNKLRRAVDLMRESGADGYSSDLTGFWEHGRQLKLHKAGADRDLDYLFQGASAGCTYVLTTQFASLVARSLGGRSITDVLPNRASHDWLIYALCRGFGFGWVRDTTANIMYRQHAGNVYGAGVGFYGIVRRFLLARSGWYFEQILFLESLLPHRRTSQRVFLALRRLSVRDRMWLFVNSYRFRRSIVDSCLLALFFLVAKRARPVSAIAAK